MGILTRDNVCVKTAILKKINAKWLESRVWRMSGGELEEVDLDDGGHA